MDSLKKDNVISLPSIGSFVEGFILEKEQRALYIDLSPYGTGIIQGVNYLETKSYIKKLEKGTKVLVKILDWNNEEGLIEMALQNLEKEKAWKKIKEMQKEDLTLPLLISEVNAGGLMGNIENIKGFLPASQLSASHYPKVDEGNKNKILEKLKFLIGEKIQVKILDFDPSANKLIFSEKLVEKDKTKDLISKYKIGDKIQVKITKIVDFGAFVKLEDTEVDGLVHISEISNKSIDRIEDILKEGETKEAKIININDNKISLSFKDLEEKSIKETK
ncbi:MAG TPA: S1 RNA-binding domain-containing protein [Patescibacteria group bacterium]|nr:S1 RNA-binding domain-containing protein [Patescibacteria group bacterium]